MNRRSTDKASEAIDKLVSMIEKKELTLFDKKEAEALKQMAKTWTQLSAVIALGGLIGSGLKWFVGIAAAWIVFKEGLFDLIRQAAGR